MTVDFLILVDFKLAWQIQVFIRLGKYIINLISLDLILKRFKAVNSY